MDLSIYLHQHPKQHLIFDFGNTLFYHQFKWDTLAEQLRDVIQEISSDMFQRYYHDTSAMTNAIIDAYGPRVKSRIDQIWADFEVSNIHQIEPNQKLVNFIESCHGKYHFYLWSSNSRALIETVLVDYNLSNLFEIIVTREDVTHLKPNPEGFQAIANPEHIRQSEFLLIGDSHHDETAAKLLGIDFYQIGYYPPPF